MIYDGDEPNRNLRCAAQNLQNIFEFPDHEVLELSLQEADFLAKQFFLTADQGKKFKQMPELAPRLKDFAEKLYLSGPAPFNNQILMIFLVDDVLAKKSPNILEFVNSDNPELSLFVSSDPSDHTYRQVQGYFDKVKKRAKFAEVISFTNFNELVGRFQMFPEVQWTTKQNFKQSSGYFYYILNDRLRGFKRTLALQFEPL